MHGHACTVLERGHPVHVIFSSIHDGNLIRLALIKENTRQIFCSFFLSMINFSMADNNRRLGNIRIPH